MAVLRQQFSFTILENRRALAGLRETIFQSFKESQSDGSPSATIVLPLSKESQSVGSPSATLVLHHSRESQSVGRP